MVHRRLTGLVEAVREGGRTMNYEIQWKCGIQGDWFVWSIHKPLRRARCHIALLRSLHPDLKFRIVRVTRKVVNG